MHILSFSKNVLNFRTETGAFSRLPEISRTEFAAALQGRVLQAFFPRHAKKDFGAVIAAAIEALESGSAGAHHEPGRWQRGGEEAEEAPAEEEVPVGLPA